MTTHLMLAAGGKSGVKDIVSGVEETERKPQRRKEIVNDGDGGC